MIGIFFFLIFIMPPARLNQITHFYFTFLTINSHGCFFGIKQNNYIIEVAPSEAVCIVYTTYTYYG